MKSNFEEFYSLYRKATRYLLQNINKILCTVLVTSCPTCMLHLQENARNIKVIDIAEAILDL